MGERNRRDEIGVVQVAYARVAQSLGKVIVAVDDRDAPEQVTGSAVIHGTTGSGGLVSCHQE